MNSAQIKLIVTWVLTATTAILISAAALMNQEWVNSHRKLITLGVIAVFGICILASRKRLSAQTNANYQSLGSIIKSNPWLKVYFVVCSIITAIALNYALLNNISLHKFIGYFELLIIFAIFFIVPAYIVKAINNYANATKKI